MQLLTAHDCGRVPFALAACTAGCGQPDYTGPRRFPLSGNVTYDGEPIDFGSISFLPAGGEQRVSGGIIENGSYSVPTPKAPMPASTASRSAGTNAPANGSEIPIRAKCSTIGRKRCRHASMPIQNSLLTFLHKTPSSIFI